MRFKCQYREKNPNFDFEKKNRTLKDILKSIKAICMYLCCGIDHLRCEGRNVMYKHVQSYLSRHCDADNNLKRDSFSDYTLNNQCRFYQKVKRYALVPLHVASVILRFGTLLM